MAGKYRDLNVKENIAIAIIGYIYGRPEDKEPILKEHFSDRHAALLAVGLELKSVKDLMKYYNITSRLASK